MIRYILNETAYHGRGSRMVLPEELKKRNYNKVFIVTDKNLIEIGNTAKITCLLDDSKIEYDTFSNIKPNPIIENVMEGLEKCRNFKPDVILAVGGGSVMDTAKAISVLMTNTEYTNLVQLETRLDSPKKGFPLILVSTTNGTGSETTIEYVITDNLRKKKMAIMDRNVNPVLSISDSEFAETLTKELASSTGMDALTHAVEAFSCNNANELSDMYCLQAIKLIYANLEKAVNERDEKSIENMALAQYLAGAGFSNTGLGIVHSLAHALSGIYDTPHGLANAIMLPHVIRFNGQVCYEKYRRILVEVFEISEAKYFNKNDISEELASRIEVLNMNVGINENLKEIRVREEDFDELAKKAFEDMCTQFNPVKVTKEDLKQIYINAY